MTITMIVTNVILATSKGSETTAPFWRNEMRSLRATYTKKIRLTNSLEVGGRSIEEHVQLYTSSGQGHV